MAKFEYRTTGKSVNPPGFNRQPELVNEVNNNASGAAGNTKCNIKNDTHVLKKELDTWYLTYACDLQFRT